MKNTYKDKTLIELMDETLREITSDQWCASEGCDTCGYGSSYITEISFMFDKCYVNVKDDCEYEYGNHLTGTFFLKFLSTIWKQLNR